MELENALETRAKQMFDNTLKELSDEETYVVLLSVVKDLLEDKKTIEGPRKVYYFSAEFLIGKLMSNNLINLGIRKEVKDILEKNGHSLGEIEEIEAEPSLGNGGLGRLAACFLDSIATLDLPGDGVGLNYHLGLFKQEFKDNKQYETPNPWIGDYSWLIPTNKTYTVEYKDFCLKSKLYDLDVIGYKGNKNKLHLFDIDTVDESIVHDGIEFDKENILKNLTLFLYPDDSDEDGRKLRIYQQYFMVSNGAQMIIEDLKKKKLPLDQMDKYVCIQINDTHPSMVIPELIRLLMKEGLTFKTAERVVSHTCAYTNHTILAEALEKWPIDVMRDLLPRIYQIIEEIDRRFVGFVKMKTDGDEEILRKVRILKDGQVHMANLAIAGSFSVNGVAALHTEILKTREMKEFNDLFPGKFNNKTNGVTHRRWLAYSNPELTALLHETIGDDWIKEPDLLSNLNKYVNDSIVQAKFYNVKQQRKQVLADYIKEHNGVEVDVNSIFDIQVKRLHAYKRQLLNIMHVIYLYQEMKANPDFRIYPHTFIFGAKAAPSYYFAKKVIKLINSVADVVNNDRDTNAYLKVVFLENYGVTLAEKIMPAADVSEQISTAGKEASGTGNMKFMMNGAVSLGTMDGANVEMYERLGDDNIVIFGLKDHEVEDLKRSNTYSAWNYYNNDPKIKKVVDSLTDGTFHQSREEFKLIFDELMSKNDEYFLLADFESYREAQAKINELYQDRQKWSAMCLKNIAESGYFSSDRTIEEYVNDIWHLEKVKH